MSPVFRFKTFEEAEQALWCFEPDEAYWERVRRLWALGDRLATRRYPRGVFRYRTVEEANREADRWIISNAVSGS